MKNEKQRFVPLAESFDQFVQALPESERLKLKEPLNKLKVAAKTATQVLFWTKIAPEVGKDSPFFAKWASQDLKAHKLKILRAAERNDRQFFIDLGKCLSDHMDSALCDKVDECVALVLALNPISAREGVHLLEKLGCPRITEENFRVRKARVIRAMEKFGLALGSRKQQRLTRRHRQSR